jgi:UDP-glucose 4-epimerase
VGGAVARRLVAGGHEVVGLARRLTRIPGLAQAPMIDLASPDLAERVQAAVPRCQAIVHAGAALDKEPDSQAVTLVNCRGTQQVVAVAEAWGAALAFISGVTVVGTPRALPVDEDHPVHPPTAYHASKVYGEHLVALAADRGLAAYTLRLTSPVGPGTPDGRILTVFVRQALAGEPLRLAGSGARRQDYVDVRDAAAAVEAALERGALGRFNVAAGSSVSNRELAEAIVERLGSTSAVETTGQPDPDEDVRWDVSIERARGELGWEPRHTLADAIDAAADDARHAGQRRMG